MTCRIKAQLAVFKGERLQHGAGGGRETRRERVRVMGQESAGIGPEIYYEVCGKCVGHGSAMAAAVDCAGVQSKAWAVSLREAATAKATTKAVATELRLGCPPKRFFTRIFRDFLFCLLERSMFLGSRGQI